MKTLMIAVIGMIASAQVMAQDLSAQGPVPFQSQILIANLNRFTLQPETTIAKDGIVGASVSIDQSQQTMKVVLFGRNHCPKGAMCLVGPRIYSYDAPLKNVEVNNCGARIYHAEQNLLPVDGIMTDIMLIDNSTNVCKTFVALPTTEVVLTIQLPRDLAPEKHYLYGDEKLHLLQPLM